MIWSIQVRAGLGDQILCDGTLENITSEVELHALDRALVVISVDPDVGEPIPGDTAGPRLRQYTDDIEHVRVLYFVTAPDTTVIWGNRDVAAAQVRATA